MLNQSSEAEKPRIALGDHTTPALQLRDSEGFRFRLEPVCERY
jgi:hypothetical protein